MASSVRDSLNSLSKAVAIIVNKVASIPQPNQTAIIISIISLSKIGGDGGN